VRDERGRCVGEHMGLSFYTLGQRQGLGIGGVKASGAARGAGAEKRVPQPGRDD
jgi:tRNA-specific 2-thiouridylase